MNDRFAIIVPYRNRMGHLRLFVPHMLKRFKRSTIFLIEQGDGKPFNRGALLNIGFEKFGVDFPYCAFHDIDMLPFKSDYSYPSCPTHLATKVSQFRYEMPSPDYFGGVVLFNTEDYIKCGGFSNNFWGWGGEDNEIFNHLTAIGMRIQRRICSYESLYHPRSCKNPLGYDPEKLAQSKIPRQPGDGLGFTKYHEMMYNEKFYMACNKLTVSL